MCVSRKLTYPLMHLELNSSLNRLALEAFHFNENSSREQAVTSSGEERFFQSVRREDIFLGVNSTYNKYNNMLILTLRGVSVVNHRVGRLYK